MLRLVSDADVHGAILRGLRRRVPMIDLFESKKYCRKALPIPRFSLLWPRRMHDGVERIDRTYR